MKPQTYFHLPGWHKFFALFFVFELTLARASQQKIEAIRLDGHDHASLADWAPANDLDWHWFAGGKMVEVTNRTTRLVFKVNSAQAEINGIHVGLSVPFAVEKAIPFVARLDLDTAICPLLFPPHFAESKPVKTICLDPGHGGKDSGPRIVAGWRKPSSKAFWLTGG